jgi:hypothetical protein
MSDKVWMAVDFSWCVIGAAFVAFCVWLTVRIINRREPWAKWTLAAAIVVPPLYVLSVGPAMWLCGGDKSMPEWLLAIYRPIRVMPDGPEFVEDAFDWYVGLWAR